MHGDDPADMSIDERLDELASLLAAGFLRLKRRTGCLRPITREATAHLNGPGGLPVAAPENRSLTRLSEYCPRSIPTPHGKVL